MSKTPQKVTITDVAQTANVAVGTVSRVLNNFDDVNPEVRARVMAAVQKLNYSRLRKRKNQRTNTRMSNGQTPRNVGVICFGMEDTLVQLPVVSSALQEIEMSVSAAGGSLMLATIPRADRVPAFLKEGRVDGLILKGPNLGTLPSTDKNELLKHLYKLPRVWLMGRLTDAVGDHCNFDTNKAGSIAAKHLHEKGHRRFAFLNPKPGQGQFEKVKAGFCAKAAELNCTVELIEAEALPTTSAWPLPATTSQEKVEVLVDRWAQMPIAKRPTAIFVPSDRSAIQTYSALRSMGKEVGVDVSVISCNNEESIITGLEPSLTTIDVHAQVIGSRAVGQLLWRIEHPDDSIPMQVLVEPKLIERDSVAQLH